ncbi:hypothetical protein AB0O76_11290 [Streptomyces sp. NPDC086554]|uniref:hypothetical protein n=1 Tax=Streptomyces sp. NPDC086554 TaxID=3154864 RepID=UPI00343A8A79
MNQQANASPPDDATEGGHGVEEEPSSQGTDDEGARPTAEEAPAPEAWEAIEQLFALVPHLRSGRANVMGDTEVSGDVVAGDKHIGVHLHSEPSPRLRTVGPLPASELLDLSETFAPNQRYGDLCAELADRRLIVLRGRPNTGRRAAALRMLVQIGSKDGEVIALDPGIEPADFADHIKPDRAHLVLDPVTDEDGPLRDIHLNAVRRRLGKHGLFILVTTHRTATVDVEACDWVPPSPADVVRAHLSHAIRRSAADGPSWGPDEIDTVQRLLELEVTVGYLSAGPSPREAAGFAQLLFEYDAGHCDETALSGYGRLSTELTASGWFGKGSASEGEVTLRDKAFLISLAVFDGSPYSLIADLGDQLYRRLLAVQEPGRPAGYEVFGASPADRLALARAREYEDETDTPWGRLPEWVVAFENSSLWSTVLRHVWTSHPAVRIPLLDWLHDLVSDRRSVVRLRAAVTAGVLAAADFGYAFDRYLNRWGSSPRPMERQLAAWALYTSAQHDMGTAVRRLLGDWSKRHDLARRWTVARTYALLGGATVMTALRDIELMATTGPEPDAPLHSALEQTLESLLQGPAAPVVLEQLVHWHRNRGALGELATTGFLRGARRNHCEPGTATAWPRLLWLADHDRRAQQQVIAMWRELLGDRAARNDAQNGLKRWVRVAERASARAAQAHAFEGMPLSEGMELPEAVSDVESALARLLPRLVETPNDWDRLDYLLRRLNDHGRTPSRTAVRLRAVLHDEPPALPGTV